MKKQIGTLLLTLGLCHSVSAGNGGVRGGGGFAKFEGDTPVAAVLLDFWEGENGKLDRAPGKIFHIKESNDPYIQQAYDALKKTIGNSIYGEETPLYRVLKSELDFILSDGMMIKENPDVDINFPSDANSNYKKSGYTPIGLGLYDDYYSEWKKSHLHYKKELLDVMTSTHRAGFLVHEAVYHFLRRRAEIIDAAKRCYVNVAGNEVCPGMPSYSDLFDVHLDFGPLGGFNASDSRLARYLTVCMFSDDCQWTLGVEKSDEDVCKSLTPVFRCETSLREKSVVELVDCQRKDGGIEIAVVPQVMLGQSVVSPRYAVSKQSPGKTVRQVFYIKDGNLMMRSHENLSYIIDGQWHAHYGVLNGLSRFTSDNQKDDGFNIISNQKMIPMWPVEKGHDGPYFLNVGSYSSSETDWRGDSPKLQKEDKLQCSEL